MAKKIESKEVSIKGNKLECPICNNDKFWPKKTLMNTPGLTFFGLEWSNKAANNYICDSCGYVYWFLNK